MAIYKLQCSIWGDTLMSRDACIITPHFSGSGIEPQTLCDDLADALSTYFIPANSRQIQVKAYDAQGTKPVYPVGDALRHAGLAPVSPLPREVALCLSFYADRNIPRRRGRLYLPAPFLWTAVDGRPSGTQMVKVRDLSTILADLGGINVDWVVYSPSDNAAHTVTNVWVDDEWDTMRSRGQRATTRTVATTSG